MSGHDYKPTKMELLRVKREHKLASKGHSLLKKKQDGLVIEFFKQLKEIKKMRSEISEELKKAGKSLAIAGALQGDSEIERIANGVIGDVTMEVSSRKFMGVNMLDVADVNIDSTWRPHLDTTPELDAAVVQYRELFPLIVQLAQKQLVLRNLADELRKTKRRVNALENIIIPRLEEVKKMIAFKLEEGDRENFARLKMIKKRVSS